jgi:hypothetical protein
MVELEGVRASTKAFVSIVVYTSLVQNPGKTMDFLEEKPQVLRVDERRNT